MKFKIFFQNIFIVSNHCFNYNRYLSMGIYKILISSINELGRSQYIDNNYNQKNELLRYLNFILLPLITLNLNDLF